MVTVVGYTAVFHAPTDAQVGLAVAHGDPVRLLPPSGRERGADFLRAAAGAARTAPS